MVLAPYRLVWLTLWAHAPPEENTAITGHLRTALEPHGEVVVHARGPFHRTPEMLHFEVELTPRESTSGCLKALGFTCEDGFVWSGWERPVNGGVFLHPAVYGAQAGEEEAAAAPRFATGDVVRVRDSSEARKLGLAGNEVTVRHPNYDSDAAPAQRTWRYSVGVEGQDESEILDESDLEPAGRSVQVYGERISITSDGVLVEPAGVSGTSDGS